MRRTIAFLLVSFAPGCTLSGSTAMVLVDGPVAYVAADSLRTRTLVLRKTRVLVAEKTCKIHQVSQDVFVVMTGIVTASGGWDANQLARQSFSTRGASLAARVELFRRAVAFRIADWNPILRKRINLDVVVVGRTRKGIEVFRLGLVAPKRLQLPNLLPTRPGLRIFEAIGHQTQLTPAILGRTFGQAFGDDPPAALRRLIELEVAAHPRAVGPPIDVLRITPDGAEWVERSPDSACPESISTEHER